MTLNAKQAQHENEELYNDAVESEIRDVLASDGPQYRGQVAAKIGKTSQETGKRLKAMYARGDIEYKWTTGKFSL